MPYLLAKSGVKEGLVVQRVHYAWKRYLGEMGLLDLVWRERGTEIPLRVQHSPSYSVTTSCGPITSLCPQFDFNSQIWDACPISFENVRQRAEVIY
jgi:hypothetical protein